MGVVDKTFKKRRKKLKHSNTLIRNKLIFFVYCVFVGIIIVFQMLPEEMESDDGKVTGK